MVKLGFVVEDKAFEAIIKSADFDKVLQERKLELTGVYNVKGRDDLRNSNIRVKDFFRRLIDKESDYIFVLVDKENDPCITFTKENIHLFDEEKQKNIIASKAIESWFLADSKTLTKYSTNLMNMLNQKVWI